MGTERGLRFFMSKLRDYAPVLLVICCAALFGTLLLTGAIDLNTIPALVANRPVLAVCVVLLFFVIKGLSGVVVYNALIIVVSLIFPLPAALAINAVGTAVCLSVSYWIGRRTKTESLEQKLAAHPKLQKYFSATREYGFVSCFAIHLIGLNMEVLGILFGMLRIDFWAYLASSWLAIIPGMICFTIAGAELSLRSPLFWLVLAIDGVLILFGILYTKKKIINRQEG